MKIRPSDTQIGGDHYVEFDIQPAEFFHRNKIPKLEGDIMQYVLRHEAKNGKEDLLKARHILDLLIEYRYADRPEDSAGEDSGVRESA